MVKRQSSFDKFLQFFSSLKCGLTLLGLLGTAVILGTVILQRPMAREGQIEQIYAPQTVRLLDALGLFDVFHTWWFILLLGLLGANIALASLERFPQAWRYFSRPHLLADEWFVRNLPVVREIPLHSRRPQEALPLVAREFQRQGFRARPGSLERGTLYVEKHRVARLAPYVVHLSLLVIFAGAIVDAVWGYRGFISLGPGMRSQVLDPLAADAAPQRLPFILRCDGAGMEKYTDGSPRQYWSQLAVEENGREVLTKRIHVNEPLTYKGIRFFQSNYGSSGKPTKLSVEARWTGQVRAPQTVTLRPGEKVPLGDSGTQVEVAAFVPDFVLEGNQLATRSDEPNNPAVQLRVSQPGGKESSVWFFPKFPQMNPPNDSGINFELRDVEMGYVTGLQVAKQPGNGLIWGGCLLLTLGLVLALYMAHIRIWGVVGKDAQGRPVMLLGGQPSKYRESFEVRFSRLADQVENSLSSMEPAVAELERLSA
jgi:cytochrome c biogenesis protein